MSFAALQATVNASVLAHLANATVRIGGSENEPGIFRNPSRVLALGEGAADTRPTVTVASSVVPSEPDGQLLEVDGVPYTIAYDAPDGTGLTVLTLELVQ